MQNTSLLALLGRLFSRVKKDEQVKELAVKR